LRVGPRGRFQWTFRSSRGRTGPSIAGGRHVVNASDDGQRSNDRRLSAARGRRGSLLCWHGPCSVSRCCSLWRSPTSRDRAVLSELGRFSRCHVASDVCLGLCQSCQSDHVWQWKCSHQLGAQADPARRQLSCGAAPFGGRHHFSGGGIWTIRAGPGSRTRRCGPGRGQLYGDPSPASATS
jgi:hypothetical protein